MCKFSHHQQQAHACSGMQIHFRAFPTDVLLRWEGEQTLRAAHFNSMKVRVAAQHLVKTEMDHSSSLCDKRVLKLHRKQPTSARGALQLSWG